MTAGAAGPVDAHQHFWHADAVGGQSWRNHHHAGIARAFLPTDLAPELARAGVARTVLMQAADTDRENRDLARFAATAPFVAGVVAWLPLPDPPRAAAGLAALTGQGMPVRGVRCLVGADPMEWATTGAATRLWRRLAGRGLCWDVVPLTPEQVAAVCAVADAVPDLRIVVDHLARPPLDGGDSDRWRASVGALAGRPNLAIKLSVGVDVLTRWRAWQPAALRPYLAYALERFGPHRCMLASNWPVSLLRVDYATGWSDLRSLVADLAPAELARVSGGTAAEWYRLDANAGRHHGCDPGPG